LELDRIITLTYIVRGGTYLYKIQFYKDPSGHRPVREFILELSRKKGKNSRINLGKIQDYIKALRQYGTRLGEPYVKHIEGDIWELRPLRNRIFFVGWTEGKFILLHHFMKKTGKTPKREVEKAKREYADFIKRSDENE